MSNLVTQVTDAPGAVVSAAKRKPVMTAVVVLVAAILILRFRAQIARFLVGLPVVGPFMAKLIG